MGSNIKTHWRPAGGFSSPKNVHCLSGGVENADNKRQNVGNPLSPARSSSPTGLPAAGGDSDSYEGSIHNTPRRQASAGAPGPNVGLNTTKGQPGSFASPPYTAVRQGGNTAQLVPQVRENQGSEPNLQCDGNGTLDSPRGRPHSSSSTHHAEKSKEYAATDNEGARIRLPSITVVPVHSNKVWDQAVQQDSPHSASTRYFGPPLNNIPDDARRVVSWSERTGWSSSPPSSMPPPPLPPQFNCASQLEPIPRTVERTPGAPRTTPLSVSELIHREATGTEGQRTPRTSAVAPAGDPAPSLASEFIDALRLRERVAEANMPKFLRELNHQLSLTGLLREAREHICGTLELTERQRDAFVQQTQGMLRPGDPGLAMRNVVARAVVGMGERDMAGFESEVLDMLRGSLQKPTSPLREAICCAAYAARFPEEQQAELRRQLKKMAPAAFRSQQPPGAAAGGDGVRQPGAHNLPPPRECEKLGDDQRAGPAAFKVRKEEASPANYSLREFPIFSSH